MVLRQARAQDYTFASETLRDAITQRVELLLSNTPSVYPAQYHEILFERACAICEDEYSPTFMMIDGDNPERNSIEIVFPGLPIQLCQFHFMRACMKQARLAFGSGRSVESKVQAFADRLRRCQRCPSADKWLGFYRVLKHDISEIAQDHGQAKAHLTKYFDSEWFCVRWRPYCIDYVIPPQYTRDGPWWTNNYAELAFRTFDKVFLMCRVNKRLGIITARCRPWLTCG